MQRHVNVIGVAATRLKSVRRAAPYTAAAAKAGCTVYSWVGRDRAGSADASNADALRTAYHSGMAGIPISNVNNNCAADSSARISER
jgi:hypothetical protein